MATKKVKLIRDVRYIPLNEKLAKPGKAGDVIEQEEAEAVHLVGIQAAELVQAKKDGDK